MLSGSRKALIVPATLALCALATSLGVTAPACRATDAPAAAAMSPNAATRRLRGPFDVEARRALIAASIVAPTAATSAPAGPPPLATTAPIRDISGVSFYVDESKSIAD